jgi:hypothetical protein
MVALELFARYLVPDRETAGRADRPYSGILDAGYHRQGYGDRCGPLHSGKAKCDVTEGGKR